MRKCITRYKELENVGNEPERIYKIFTSENINKQILQIFERNPTISLKTAKVNSPKKKN